MTYIFATQVFISCSSLGFAMMMLYKGKDPGTYLPIITGIIGCWLPSPQHIAKEANNLQSDVEQPFLPRS
jgi:hypothetical protein